MILASGEFKLGFLKAFASRAVRLPVFAQRASVGL